MMFTSITVKGDAVKEVKSKDELSSVQIDSIALLMLDCES